MDTFLAWNGKRVTIRSVSMVASDWLWITMLAPGWLGLALAGFVKTDQKGREKVGSRSFSR